MRFILTFLESAADQPAVARVSGHGGPVESYPCLGTLLPDTYYSTHTRLPVYDVYPYRCKYPVPGYISPVDCEAQQLEQSAEEQAGRAAPRHDGEGAEVRDVP